MARSKRLHIPSGFYYLVLRGSGGRQVFPQASDFSEFAALVARHLEACHIQLLAFCWVTDAALDRLVDSIAARLHVRPDELQSRSRRRILSLGRAAVAWHATRSGIARLNEVARRLNRHSSTLSLGVVRYRHQRPELFEEPLATLLARPAAES